ncbi:MAG: GGDEF domain-containing protein [Lachnospiraceae bacterium]|nr:GGDEF domain-containing protein [Lachnospiraceae bacterium]MCI9545625.1 GGDEF domain-containing protein [Lachnospiraceae bacterium]
MNGQDSLTGLYDWQTAREKITDLLDGEKVESGLLFYMDLDDFQEVNDSYGYAAGDELLKAVGERLLQMTHGQGVAARIGGDEFLLFLGNVSSQKEAYNQAMQLYGACMGASEESLVSMSMGIACYPEDGSVYEELAARADEALYASKHAGKQCFLFYEDLSRL